MRPAFGKRNEHIHVMWPISWTSPKLQLGHSWALPCQDRGYIQIQLQLWTNYRKVGDEIRLFFFFFLYLSIIAFGEGNGTPLQYCCLENPVMEEPGRLQSMGSGRVGHDWATSLSLFTFMHWRRKWQPTPVFLPGESQGWGSLVGCHLWGRTESDTTEAAAA